MSQENNEESAVEVVPNQENGVARGVFYSAPLPPASEFERYERVLPGSADRIIKLAENQNGHRRFVENVVVIFDSLKSLTGLIGALAIVLAGMWCGVYLIMHDKSTEGFVAILSPLGAIVGAFIFKEWVKKDDE
jgi:uncharacterized membrane protein